MLFVPDEWIVEAGSEWERLRQAKESWLYLRGLEKMTGFCRGKISEYGIYGEQASDCRGFGVGNIRIVDRKAHAMQKKAISRKSAMISIR